MLSLHTLSLYASTTETLTKARFHALCDRIADAAAALELDISDDALARRDEVGCGGEDAGL